MGPLFHWRRSVVWRGWIRGFIGVAGVAVFWTGTQTVGMVVGVLMMGTAAMYMQQVRRGRDCQLYDDAKDNDVRLPLHLLRKMNHQSDLLHSESDRLQE
ncbi:MAG: hypothetical protein NXI04_19475 [Planctomycetaceae bacterium]|nr:hypothetical protein [Planctomycetaceae bacterium]